MTLMMTLMILKLTSILKVECLSFFHCDLIFFVFESPSSEDCFTDLDLESDPEEYCFVFFIAFESNFLE